MIDAVSLNQIMNRVRALLASWEGSPNLRITNFSVNGVVPITKGGTGGSTIAQALTNLGGTTVGKAIFAVPNPSAIRFLKVNADNTVTLLNDSDFRTAIGAGTGTGTVNTGTQYQLSYYAANGTTVSGLTLITASRALVSDANGLPVAATTTATEIGYVNGVTSAIQTQIDSKAPNVLTGYVSGAGVVAATDTVLQAIQKLNGNIAGISTAITIGSTVITGGTNTRILYNNAGVVGEYEIGAGIAAFLATPSSANLLAAMTTSTGGGNLVFASSPTFVSKITTPQIYGGAAVGSSITYTSTTANGTAAGAAHTFQGGNNGATEIGRMLNNGSTILGGATALIASEVLSVQKNQNAFTQFIVSNSTSGTGSAADIVLFTNGSAFLEMTMVSSGYSSSGMLAANTARIATNSTALSLGTTGSAFVRVFTANIERFRWDASGNYTNTAGTGTAYIHLKGGTATASTAPLKLTGGTNLTTAEVGAMEYNGTSLFFTPTGTTRLRTVLTDNSIPSNGQLPIGNGANYTNATLTEGAGITITNGAGSVTIATNGTFTGTSTTKTTTYTATPSDFLILCDASSAAFTVTLPTAISAINKILVLKKTDATGNSVTARGNGSELIDGANIQNLDAQFESMIMQSNGTAWYIIGIN